MTTGESAANGTVGDAWGFVFNLTLRGGPMRYETHQYMEFRYVQIDVLAGAFDVATNLDVGAWTAEYPYDAAESSFDSMTTATAYSARSTRGAISSLRAITI